MASGGSFVSSKEGSLLSNADEDTWNTQIRLAAIDISQYDDFVEGLNVLQEAEVFQLSSDNTTTYLVVFKGLDETNECGVEKPFSSSCQIVCALSKPERRLRVLLFICRTESIVMDRKVELGPSGPTFLSVFVFFP